MSVWTPPIYHGSLEFSKFRVVLIRIPAAQLSVWLCLETGSLSGAAGPAGGLVHPAATPSCRQTTQDKQLYILHVFTKYFLL